MEDETSNSTDRQLEQSLSQRIQVLYLATLGHQPNQVSCQVIGKTLAITVENPITQPERLLAESGKHELAQQVRFNIEKAFLPQLKALIEEVLEVSVIDILGDSKISTGRTKIVALLDADPTSQPNIN